MLTVTISSPYGAGGSVLAPAVAARLGLPFLDRAVSAAVAKELDLTPQEAESGGRRRTWLERMATTMAPLAPELVAAQADLPPLSDEQGLREATEQRLRSAARRTGCVVLGRAGAWALADEPVLLKVRLYGPVDRRIAAAARANGTDEAAEARVQAQVDRARADYVRRLYGADVDAPGTYHLQVDTTVVPVQAAVDLVVRAAEALGR